MFSLIVTLISIALVAALALATLYYGGTAFVDNGEKAQAARLLNESQQLAGAITLHKAREGADVTDLGQLVARDYLSALPGGAWQVIDGGVARTDLSEDQCLSANKQLGINVVPTCNDPAFSGVEVCCSMPD